jgi:hypothetical protein
MLITGGQFGPKRGGQFALKQRGHFAPKWRGQFGRNIQLKVTLFPFTLTFPL